ncbi:unnamed protein product, partial [Ectocarpus sp. 6 AP-2014]
SAQDPSPPQHKQQPISSLSGTPEPNPARRGGAKMQASSEHLGAITAGGGLMRQEKQASHSALVTDFWTVEKTRTYSPPFLVVSAKPRP